MSIPRSLLATLLAAIVVPSLVSCSSNDANPPQPAAKATSVDPAKIKRGPVLHQKLSESQLARLKHLHETFADVDGQTLAQWEDDFKRDADPDENLRIWEDMEVAYSAFCKGKNLDLRTRKEVLKVVLLRSMVDDEDVLRKSKLTILTDAQAKEIMQAYPSKPRPLQVIDVSK